MKYTTGYLLLFSLVFLFSCGKEDFSEKVLGSWEVEAYRITCDASTSFYEIPWTDTTPSECISTPEFSLFWCLTGLDIIENESTIVSFISDGNALSDNSTFSFFENNRVYFCLNEDDDLEECDFVFLDGDKLIYQLFDLGTLADENCVEQYRLVKR